MGIRVPQISGALGQYFLAGGSEGAVVGLAGAGML